MEAPLCNGHPAIAHDFCTLVNWTIDGVRLRVCERCGVLEVGGIKNDAARYFMPWSNPEGT